MVVMIIRLVIVWVLLVAVVRLMGKRQIGELEMSEFITAFMLSELAALPITDSGVPLLFSVVPILLLAVFEILTSYALLHSRRLQKLVSGTPTVLIRMGTIDQAALRQSRLTLSELMGELRQKNIADPDEVAYAILEENGKLSVLPKKGMQPPTADDMAKAVKETGICHTLITDGEVSVAGLSLSGHNLRDVEHLLRQNGYRGIEEVYLMTIDDAGTCKVVRKADFAGRAKKGGT